MFCPLNALIDSHLAECDTMGIKAIKSDLDDFQIAINSIPRPNSKFQKTNSLFSSPELFTNFDARKFLMSLNSRLVGVVVDEAHSVIKW